MDASDPIRPQKPLVPRGPSTYGSLLPVRNCARGKDDHDSEEARQLRRSLNNPKRRDRDIAYDFIRPDHDGKAKPQLDPVPEAADFVGGFAARRIFADRKT